LRILPGIVTFHTRWQGSVASRPTGEELEALFAEGRRLLTVVDDPAIRARFKSAEAFLPFWVAAGGRTPTAAEMAAGDQAAHEALALAEGLGDLPLQSVALEAVGGNAQQRGDYIGMAAAARRRVEFGTRVPIFERIDAPCMVAWAAVTTGHLDEATAVTDDAIRFVQPGQAANWTLHLFAWRTVASSLRGDWDGALVNAGRAEALWVDLERIAAGYATRGFLAAFEIARARRDDAGMTRWREVLEEIHRNFRLSVRVDIQNAVAQNDIDGIRRLLGAREANAIGYETWERAISFMCDHGEPPDEAAIDHALDMVFPQAVMTRAQLARARGLGSGDAASFQAALATLRAARARPAVARVEIELGRLTGDADLVASGRRILEALGDVDQLDRYGLTA
jgi:hypothetical protein